jgi:hypothetical protein
MCIARRLVVLLTPLVLGLTSNTVQANTMMAPANTSGERPTPMLAAGEQYFDGSFSGFRSYLESIKAKDLGLYTQLDPKLARLEGRQTAGVALIVTGIVAPLAGVIIGVAAQKSCHDPSLKDPNYSAAWDDWSKCEDDNRTFAATAIVAGLVIGLAAEIGAYAVSPPRSALLDLVNEHNRLSHDPLRWQVGYNPTSQTAFGQLQLTF